MSLFVPLTGLALGLCLLPCFTAGVAVPGPEDHLEHTRSESFVLFERGRVWSAERERLGTARLTTSSQGDESEVELRIELESITTRVQRVLRRRGEEKTQTWREWRTGESERGRGSGRTLIVESGPRGSSMREWAGRAMRAEVTAVGVTTLELVESARGTRGFTTAFVSRFDPLEAESRPALVLQTPLVWGFPGGPRVLDVIDLDAGCRPSRWFLVGGELVAFAEGGWIGSRCEAPGEEPRMARAADL